MYQAQSSVPTALQALMVLRQQANPTAPGPGGQPIPTVAEQQMQKVMQPPQGPGPMEFARNAAIGGNITGMQQTQAQEALMQEMLKRQQAQAQQPVLAAEGGIASLDVGEMEDYAEGGVVGFAVGGEFASGAMDESMLAADEERIRKLLEERRQRERQKEQEFLESRAKATAEATGQPYQAPSAPTVSPAQFKFAASTPASDIINTLTGQLRNDQSLSEADRTAIAKEIQNQFVRLGSSPQEPAAPVGIPSALPAATQAPQQEVANRPRFASTLEEIGRALPAPSDTAMREEMRGLQALQAQRATPDEAIAQLEATRARQKEIYQRQLAAPGDLGELMSVLGSIGKRGDGLTGLQEYRSERNKAELAQVALDQNLSNEKRLLREKYLADQIGDKSSSLKFEEALYKNAEERQKLLAQTSASAFTAQAGMFNTETAAAQRERAALERAALAEQKLAQGAQGKPVDRATILERYADNWEKLDPMQKNDLKTQGIKTFDDYVQYRDRLLGKQTDSSGGQTIYARNPQTNERIMSTDGGVTWKPVQ